MEPHAKGVPAGASALIPRLFCRDPAAELDFCAAAFAARVLVRRPGPDGRIAHALVTIGPAMLMIESEWPEVKNRAPAPDGSSPVVLYVYVENVDATAASAARAGATILMAAADQPWGDRTAWLMDPAGHVWTIATRVEETTEAQRAARLGTMPSDTPTS